MTCPRPFGSPPMKRKSAQGFAGLPKHPLCLGEMSITFFRKWMGVFGQWIKGGYSDFQIVVGLSDSGDGIQSVVDDGWITHIHHQYNRIDSNPSFSLNSPSSRLKSCSQDITPMKHRTGVSPPQTGDDYPPPPGIGQGGQRPSQGSQTALKPVSSLPRHQRTLRVRVSFPRPNSDPRPRVYDPRQEG